MRPPRPSFTDHSFRWQPHARLDIYGRGARPMGFMPENRFGAGGKRGFRWSQSQAGLAIQPLFGLGFRLRWLGSAMEGLSVFGYGMSRQGARFARIGARFVREFRGIGADWQVWEAQSPRFSPLSPGNLFDRELQIN